MRTKYKKHDLSNNIVYEYTWNNDNTVVNNDSYLNYDYWWDTYSNTINTTNSNINIMASDNHTPINRDVDKTINFLLDKIEYLTCEILRLRENVYSLEDKLKEITGDGNVRLLKLSKEDDKFNSFINDMVDEEEDI